MTTRPAARPERSGSVPPEIKRWAHATRLARLAAAALLAAATALPLAAPATAEASTVRPLHLSTVRGPAGTLVRVTGTGLPRSIAFFTGWGGCGRSCHMPSGRTTSRGTLAFSFRVPAGSGAKLVGVYRSGTHTRLASAVFTEVKASSTTTTAPGSVTVSSVPALLRSLADNSVTSITVADGTYHVDPAGDTTPYSLWIGSAFAGRTNPVTVRAQTAGGVVFDGGGEAYFGGLYFEEGAHDQTWDGFTFQDGTPTSTGVIAFGGGSGRAAPYRITLRNITVRGVTASSQTEDHAVYFSQALGGPHDILLQNVTVYATQGSSPPALASAVHAYHSDAAAGELNAWNVTIDGLHVHGTYQAVILWDTTVHDWLIENTTIDSALNTGVRYEGPGSNITLKDVTTTNTNGPGFWSSLGSSPPGVTFLADSFH